MAHTHDVYDMENHFEINGSSRFIKETSETKLVVVQGDHKSEVLTFKMPRYIDGHDMTLCNKIRIHYINLDTKTNNKSADVYEVTDLTLCEECEDVLTFTWTIEAPATKYSGTLSFLVKFECTEGENVLYQWNTAKYVSVNVLAGIDNSEEFVEKYSNVLEEWYNELTKGADSIKELNQQAISEIELAKEDAKEDIQCKADATMAEMNQFSSNAYNSFKNDVDEKVAQTLETIPEDYVELDAEVKAQKETLINIGARQSIEIYKEGSGIDVTNTSVTANNGSFVTFRNSVFDCYVSECEQGDIFVITGVGGSGAARLWGFATEYDEVTMGFNILSCASIEESTKGMIKGLLIVPEGAKYAFFNVNNSVSADICKITNGSNIVTKEYLANEENVFIADVVGRLMGHNIHSQLTWTSGYFVSINGEISDNINFSASSTFNVLDYSQLTFTALSTAVGGVAAALSVYDADNVFIESVRLDSEKIQYVKQYKYILPDNAVYVRFSKITNESVHGAFECYGRYRNSDDSLSSLATLQYDVDSLKEDVDSLKESNVDNKHLNHIRFLVFGNSYSCDSFGYVPFILNELGITCEIYLYVRDACSLRDMYNHWESDSANDTETDGIHAGTYARKVFHIDTRTDSAWSNTTRVSMKTCLEYGNWDFISMQQWSAYSIDESTYEPWLSLVIDLIRQSIDKPTPLAWNGVCTRPTADEPQQGLDAMKNAVYKKHPFDFIIPYGTAIFNARTNETLAKIGNYANHNLWHSDGQHLQDGLPCYIASLTVCEAICNKFFPQYSVMYDKLRITDTMVNNWVVPQRNLPVVGITEENCLLAQKCAIMANKFPFEITNIESLPEVPEQE